MTEPLTPADCDLQHLPFMPLHVARLRDSDLAAEESPESCWYAVLLWAASWHQVPAASLPDNDAILARLAGLGRDLKTWRKHRAAALRGFILCTDGRLYHPVVAEQAVEAYGRSGEWQERQDNRTSRQQRWRERCKALADQLREAGVTPPAGASLKALEEMVARLPVDADVDGKASTVDVASDAPEMPLTGTRTGTSSSEDKSSARNAIPLDADAAAWKTAIDVLTERGGMTEPTARRFFGKLLSTNHLAAKDMLAPLATAIANESRDPGGYLTKSAAGIAKRRAPTMPAQRVGFV